MTEKQKATKLNPTGPMAGKFICAALLATSCWASPSSNPPGAARSSAFVSPCALGRVGGARRRGDATCTSMSSTAAEDDVKGTAPKKVALCPWLTTNRRIHRFVNRMPHISRGGRPFPCTEMVMVYDVRVQVILICTGDACEDEGSRQLLKCARATIPGKTHARLQMPVICSLGSAMSASVSSPFSTPHIETTTALFPAFEKSRASQPEPEISIP